MSHRRARSGRSEGTPPATPAPAPGVLASLRERKVVQWTLAYAAAAAALLQVLALVAAQFAWPDAVGRSATVVLACGLPVAAVIAWYHGDRGAQRVGGLELLILAGLFASAAGLLWWINREDGDPPPPPAAVPRIAVLPLDNLSPDPANAFFADGLHDELLTALTRLGSVEVVSRTTMLSYRDARPTARVLAAQLGATHLMEGTVQREGDTVRMNLQLIDAKADRRVWGESYTRTLDDALGLQGEIALAVAAGLRTRIGHANRTALTATAGVDPRALDALLKARQVDEVIDTDGFDRRRRLLDEAVALAPGYGRAHAERATHLATSVWFARGDRAADTALARNALAEAARLEPDAMETAQARATVEYYIDRDLARALATTDAALARWPNAVALLALRERLLRRLSRFDDSIATGKRLVELDPRNPAAYDTLVESLWRIREDDDGALALLERQAKLRDTPNIASTRANIELARTADIAAWLRTCPELAVRYEREGDEELAWSTRLGCAETAGDWAEAERLAASALRQEALAGSVQVPLSFRRLNYAYFRGDATAVASHYRDAVAALEAERGASPDGRVTAWLAVAHALGGDRAAARAALDETDARAAAEPDVIARSNALNEAVFASVRIEEPGRALARLRARIGVPYGISRWRVLHEPRLTIAFEGDPGFRDLQAQVRRRFATRATAP